jgi:hypothetical protein
MSMRKGMAQEAASMARHATILIFGFLTRSAAMTHQTSVVRAAERKAA